MYDRFGRVERFNDGKARQEFTYDPVTWFTTRLADSQAGVWSAAVSDYDADGTLRAWDGPHGLRVESEFDAAGNPVRQVVTQTEGCEGEGCVAWYVEDVEVSIHGQWLSHDRSVAERDYRYDAAGRLIEATEDVGGVCQTRSYAFG